jgi:hypothetical protein
LISGYILVLVLLPLALSSLAGFTEGGLCSSGNPGSNNLLNNDLLNTLIKGKELRDLIAHKGLDELLELEFEW